LKNSNALPIKDTSGVQFISKNEAIDKAIDELPE
jgi:hypothetical protein